MMIRMRLMQGMDESSEFEEVVRVMTTPKEVAFVVLCVFIRYQFRHYSTISSLLYYPY